jgi:uncharacterized protein YjiS (DUF1127 family)
MSVMPDLRRDNLPHQEAQLRETARFDRHNAWAALGRVWGRISLWQQKRASRRVLRDLTDTELLDIGISRADAGKEVGKSFFWD